MKTNVWQLMKLVESGNTTLAQNIKLNISKSDFIYQLCNYPFTKYLSFRINEHDIIINPLKSTVEYYIFNVAYHEGSFSGMTGSFDQPIKQMLILGEELYNIMVLGKSHYNFYQHVMSDKDICEYVDSSSRELFHAYIYGLIGYSKILYYDDGVSNINIYYHDHIISFSIRKYSPIIVLSMDSNTSMNAKHYKINRFGVNTACKDIIDYIYKIKESTI